MSWSERCEKLVCYEHVGDETEKVHIHIMLENCEVEKKMLKHIALGAGYGLKGNNDWSFKNRKDNSIIPMVYMTKGLLKPSYLKGYTDEDAVKWMTQWVEKKDESSWEKICNYVLDDEFIHENWEDYKRDVGVVEVKTEVLFFGFFLKYARKMVFARNKLIWSPAAANQYKCVVMTYIMRKNIKVPDEYKEWKKFLEI